MADKNVSASTTPVPANELRWHCDPARFEFKSTADLGETAGLAGLVGQDRATDAISFGVGMKRPGFNIFALGPPGLGKHHAIEQIIKARAEAESPPDDWAYVNNFDNPQRPVALRLPRGQANTLKSGVTELIDELKAAIPAVFESEDYTNRSRAIVEEIEEQKEKAFEEIKEKAQAQKIAIIRTPMGFSMAPMESGQVMKPEVFNALEKDKRRKIEEEIEKLQSELEGFFQNVPRQEKEKRDQIRALNEELAKSIVDNAIGALLKQFSGQEQILKYLESVRSDLVQNFALFLEKAQESGEMILDGDHEQAIFNRYVVNVIVCGEAGAEGNTLNGAPIVYEDHPTLANLIGRIEHRSHMGALVTDFTLIRPGALHQANGGYLIVDAHKLLTQPFAWDALKRMLKSGHITIESPSDYLGLVSTRSLEPDRIPLVIKLVLIGNRMLYYLLSAYDPDFANLFKVQADFDETADLNDQNIGHYVSLIAAIARREGLKPLSPGGVARVLEECVRWASDTEKLSVHVESLNDLLSEAAYRADEESARKIEASHVQQAVEARIARASRLEERSREAITRDIMLIDTSGETVGQVNGLSVLSLGGHAFGRPARITARVRMGAGKVVDIEREVDLGGPLHSKGVLILSGYLASRYALDAPISLWASLVFEQSYGGVDGDSASSAELYALLSALSDVPIRQCFAVTGSVNQRGEVQAIGGVNTKIEGFFDLCKARGLDGSHAVLVPKSNRTHLMLRSDVAEAARDGQFNIFAVGSIDEGIEILTGKPAGTRGADGHFGKDTINRMVEDRLRNFAHMRKKFGEDKKVDKENSKS